MWVAPPGLGAFSLETAAANAEIGCIRVATRLQGVVGTLPKDKFKGKFVDEWNNFLKSSNVELESRDASAVLAGVLATKDDEEVVGRGCARSCQLTLHVRADFTRRPLCARRSHHSQTKQRVAAEMSTRLMAYFSEQMSDVIESDKKITHEKIAEQLEAKLEDGPYWQKFKPTDGVGFSPSLCALASCTVTDPRCVHSPRSTGASPSGATRPSSSPTATTTSSLRPSLTTSASGWVSFWHLSACGTSRTARMSDGRS